MKKLYKLALHIFRRDLRLQDNTALIAALSQAEQIIPCFVFDKRQIGNNPYKSNHCIQFMVQSLKELNDELHKHHSRLYCFDGITEDVITHLITENKIQAVFINRDYTPFSRARDGKLESICQKHRVDFHCYADALLHEPEHVLKVNNKPYTIFTHAFKHARLLPVSTPQKNIYKNYYSRKIVGENSFMLTKLTSKNNDHLLIKGGRSAALRLIKKIPQLGDYQKIRELPSLTGTTRLSAHNKFGTISIRELYTAIVKQFDKSHALIRELYWRDFFTHLAYHFPRVFGAPYLERFSRIRWSKNKKHFQAWCEGRTGFPIVDAGMRELNATGYIHNRVRMIVASFLCKDLHIDWRAGEKYFAQTLVDYDPAINNGNWQWVASTGCDAQPYFRIFNPWLQQKKYDANCTYIKRWIPELASVPAQIIHRLFKNKPELLIDYPQPIVDHYVESQKAKQSYAKIRKN